MKTKKLNLNDLKVESFITSLEDQKINTLRGGTTSVCVVSVVAAETAAEVVVATVIGAAVAGVGAILLTIFGGNDVMGASCDGNAGCHNTTKCG